MKKITRCDKKCPFNTRGKCSQEMKEPMSTFEENDEIFCCQEEHCTGGARKVVMVSCGLVYSLNEEGYLSLSGNWNEGFLAYMEDRWRKNLSEEDKAFLILLRKAYACPNDSNGVLMPPRRKIMIRFGESLLSTSFSDINEALRWAGLPRSSG